MRKLYYFLLCGLAIVSLFSCDKEDVMRYDTERAAIEFAGTSYTYSFKKSSQTIDTVSIPFNLVGYPENVTRNAEFRIVADSTTATAAQFHILDAVMQPDAYDGMLRVEVKNEVGEAFEDVRIYFEIASGKDFIAGVDTRKNCFLYLTNKLVRPGSWTTAVERYNLGTYSTAYYQFIIQVTGETEFPFRAVVPGYNNDEKWSSGYATAFLDNLKKELKIWNKEKGTLIHDDGTAKGKEVIIGMYYQN